jgi:hypothetical protein
VQKGRPSSSTTNCGRHDLGFQRGGAGKEGEKLRAGRGGRAAEHGRRSPQGREERCAGRGRKTRGGARDGKAGVGEKTAEYGLLWTPAGEGAGGGI